ncbi:MAG: serine/threonine protein kinase [Candidatus Obscuribacterales bacterium]|nr:serine/threonine protein kinase [Candidatus Obscuribacterales bacterium]
MAELEVVAQYKSVPARVVLFALVILMPLWGVLAPIVSCVGIWVTLNDLSGMMASQEKLVQTIGVLLGLAIITIVGVLLTLGFADNKITASKAGLRIPFFLSFSTFFRRSFAWSDIRSVQLIGEPSAPIKDLVMELKTAANRSILLFLGKIHESELEQLMIATELWCTTAVKDSKLETLHNRLQGSSGADHARLSYTSMWEDELERRFAATAFVPLEPGLSLQNGRLRVVRQLSFGGLSAIYLCQDQGKDLVVLKESVIPPDSKPEIRQKAEELFARESRFLMKLDHAQIVKVLDYFAESGRNYMLLEYINGQDLRQYVKQHGPCSERTTLLWLCQICDILTYLHAQEPPVVHRDLTPDNVVLREDGTLKLIDFGAANELIGTATGTLVGKQAFISPEQLRGKATTSSDIYALGCSMFYLLTGEDPEPLSVSCVKDVRPEVSSELSALIESCTDMEAKARPQSAAAIKERAEAILASMKSNV